MATGGALDLLARVGRGAFQHRGHDLLARREQAGEGRRQPAVGAVVGIDQRALHLG
jgi:hypothetical protein